MAANNSRKGTAAPELSATMTGSWVEIGTLLGSPIQIIFDNQSTVSVAISVDGGTNTWKTFTAGTAIVLDKNTVVSGVQNFPFGSGAIFHGNGASGDFSISYLYAL